MLYELEFTRTSCVEKESRVFSEQWKYENYFAWMKICVQQKEEANKGSPRKWWITKERVNTYIEGSHLAYVVPVLLHKNAN